MGSKKRLIKDFRPVRFLYRDLVDSLLCFMHVFSSCFLCLKLVSSHSLIYTV